MIGNWAVGVTLAFTSNGALTMTRLASSTRLANAQLANQSGLISKNQLAMIRYQERMDALRTSAIKLGAAFSGIAAGVGVAAMTFGVEEAAKFQRAMTGVNIATSGATPAQRAAMQAQAVQVSGFTAQSAVTIANEMAAAAQVAFKDPKQLMALFPAMAKYADVRYMASGGKEDATHSVQQMATFAHFFGAYGVPAMQKMLDYSAKLQFTTHATLDQMVTQGKYFIPAMVRAGVSKETIFQYLAVMGQNGLLAGRGGTSMGAIQRYALGAADPTAHLSKAVRRSKAELHLDDAKFVDATGNFMLDPLVRFLQKRRDEMRAADPRLGGAKWLTDITNVFRVQGAQALAIFADKMTRGQMDRNTTAFKAIPGVDGQWKQYSGDLFYQFNAFVTNLKNLAMVIALPMLPRLTAMFGTLANDIGLMVGFLSAHPGVAEKVALGIAGVTAAFAGLAVVLSGSLIIGALAPFGAALSGMGITFGGIGLAIRILMPRLAGLIPGVGWFVAAVTLALEGFKHATDIAWMLGKVAGYIKFHLFPGIASAFQHGLSWLGSVLQSAIHGMFWAVTHPGDAIHNADRAVGNAITSADKSVESWLSGVSRAASAGFNSENQRTPQTVNLHVHVQGGDNPHKAGKIAGAAAAHELHKAGLIRNHPLGSGFGNAVPAAH